MSRTNIENIYPLSPMQEGMLFDSQVTADGSVYFVQIGWTLRGSLDVPAFLRAFQTVVDRHPILRTGFAWERLERPMQIVRKEVRLPVYERDLRDLAPNDRDREIERYAAEDRRRGFDLTRPPLMRVALFRIADDAYRFLWARHHLLLDGWSTPLVVKEVFALYDAYSRGTEPTLERSRPFGDYIRWLREQDRARVDAFWQQRLAGFSAPTPLRVDRLASGERRHGDAKLALSEDLSIRLQAFARDRRITPSTLVEGAWAVLLARYSGERDVLFGATVSGRSAPVPGIDRMIGMFINTLPVRVDVVPDESVAELLAKLQHHHVELRDYEHSALVEVQAKSRVPRGTPLFESLVVFENYPAEEALRQGSGGLSVTDARTVEASSVPLVLIATMRRALTLQIGYDARRFDDATIARMLGHVATLLESIVADPQRRPWELPMLTAEERREALHAETASFTVGACLHERFEAQVDRTPGAIAATCEGRSLRYRELDERANRLARRLRALGVAPDVLVGLALERSLDLVVAIVAVLKAGGAYVPLDPDYPRDRLAFMMADAEVRVLLTDAKHEGLVAASGASVLRVDADRDAIDREPADRLAPSARPSDLAYVLYTSGSTGKPKGAMITHANVVRLFDATDAWYRFDASDVWTMFHSYAFDFSVWELWGALLYGGRVVVVPYWVSRAPDAFHALLVDERVTVLNQTPSAFRQLVRVDETSNAELALRYVIFGGEALDVADLRPWWRRHGDASPRLVNMYGITETTVHVTYRPLNEADLDRPSTSAIGRPIPDLAVYVLDAHGEPVPIGVPGEMYVGGAGVARGYLKRPELTATRFLDDRFRPADGARLYRTGDLARRTASGDLEYLGRIDHQVKIRGFRIELGEIEAALGEHPDVREVVLIAREADASVGAHTQDKRLVAYVVARDDAPSASDLRAFLKERLPEHMVPSAFVALAALPLTENGKIDRAALPAPEAAVSREREYIAPRGPVEEELARIFAEVLGLAPSDVGAHDGFFELGGHSLLAMQIVAHVRAALGAELPLRALFEAPSPAELAARVDGARAEKRAPPLVRSPRTAATVASFGQERLWFLAQLDPNDTSYNVPFVLRMRGALDVAALERTLSEIVRRHEILRTTFAPIDGRPMQIVHAPSDRALSIVDLSRSVDAVTSLHAAITGEARIPFDLGTGPLLRAKLFTLAPDDNALLLTVHHIVADAWTRGVMNREISSIYAAFREGRPSPLPEPPIQYADYAAWQRAWLTGDVLDAQLAYWKDQLAGAPRVIDLPTDRPRPAVRTNRGRRQRVAFSPELTRALKGLARREGVTLYMVLLAALDVLLFRYSGQSDVVVGSPIAGRTHAETEDLVGFFLNTLVLRTKMSGDLTWKDLLQRVKAVCLGAYAHQDMPFERLVQELAPERDLGVTPLFQVILNLHNTPTFTMDLAGVELSGVRVESETTKYDLTLILVDGPTSIAGSLAYSTDLFDAPTIDRMIAHLTTLLEGVVSVKDARVRDLPLLADAERRALLAEWNGASTSLDAAASEDTLVDLFEAQADATPDAIALVAGESRLTFCELDARANRLAHRLRKLGVEADAVVGLCAGRTADFVIALLAILKAGGAYLPLDPAYPPPRIAALVAEARAAIVVTAGDRPLPLEGARIVRIDAESALDSEPDTRPAIEIAASSLAYVLFTSGSTGTPKGVAVEHRQIVSYVRGVAARLELPRGASYALVSTFSADLGNTMLFPPLCFGGTLHVIAEEVTTDPSKLGDYFARERIDCLKIVPSHLAALLAGARPERVIPREIVVLGGEASSWDLIDRIEQLAPSCRVFNHYGPTETTVGVIAYPIMRGDRPPTPAVPLGRPLPGARVYVLDAEMQPAPIGVPGELYVGGASVARGYLHRPDLTSERFVKDPFSTAPGARLYRTGDRARWLADGSLLFLGRVDFQVKIRGFRVELGEVEAALRGHEGIAAAVALAEDGVDSIGLRLVAYVVPREPPGPDAAELAAWLAARLPEPMIPSAFVAIEALPLTPNGKIDRDALARIDRRETASDASVRPRGPIEDVLASLWADVFQRDRVGIHERFADLGGHSLLAIQIIARARDAFQAEIPLRAIFEAPTIAALAERIEAAIREGQGLALPPITRTPREGPLPLSFAQERLWFLNRLDPESAFYNVPFNLRLTGPLDVAALARALGEVIRRHEVLRTTFSTVDGRAVQIVNDAIAIDLPIEDLSASPPSEREETMRRASADEVRRPFDLAAGPLLRTRLLRLAPDDHALLMTAHHIVSDAWTRGILYRELMAVYSAFERGLVSPLPELPIQYGDYAVWQRRFLEGEVYERQMAYWRTQLEGAPPALDLPTDRPRPPVQTYRGAWRALVLPAALAKALEELARREGATFFMTLLAGFVVLLARYSGQDDIVLGTPVAGRSRPETEGLLGFFINTLVLRTKIDDAMSFRDLVERVRETCLSAYAHQDMSFERLVQELAPERDLGRSPLFQVLFTFQNPPRDSEGTSRLTIGSVRAENPTSKYDITMALSEQERGLVAAVEYATDLFDRATIERMLLHYRTLLEGLVASPEAPLWQAPMLLADEERTLLLDWNATAAEFPEHRCVHELFEEQAARTPDAIAAACGDAQLSYRSLNERANKLARHLVALGVGPGVLVGLCVARSLDLVVGVLGVLKAGGAYVPLDPSHPIERIAWMLDDSAVAVVITQEAIADELPVAAMMVRLDADWPSIEAEIADDLGSRAQPDDLAYVIYTSGSTGKPKGVMIHHRGLCNYVFWALRAYDVAGGRGAPVHSSIGFDLTITGLFTPLLAGRTVVLLPEGGEIDALVKTLVDPGGYSLVKLTPAHLDVLEKLVPADEARGAARAFVIGGEALSWDTLAFWRKHAPETKLINEYGPTETVVGCCVYDAAREGDFAGAVPIGRPIANTQLYILDAHRRPVPIGVRGELYIGGAGVARGYLNRPELTEERFLPDPFRSEPGARVYRTGDLARYRANGDIEFLGRADHQVKIRGYRIELGEIESVLAQHPSIAEAVVAVREDVPGDKRLVAYVVVADDEGPTRDHATLRAFLAARLPDYMVPSAFVSLANLPLTKNGKIDRAALPAPEARSGIEDGYAEPRNPIEEVVVGIWADVLGVERVGVHDDFFELGGHSLIATQVMARIATALSVDLPLQSLFEAPTPAGLSARLSEALDAGAGLIVPPLVKASREGDLPLSFGQERLWFLDQLAPGSTLYVVPQAVRLEGVLDIPALERALAEIVRRHEVLRTTFASKDGRPAQIIHEPADVPLPITDLEDLAPDGREEAARREAASEAHTPFDLASGPLVRSRLLKLGADDHVLLLTMHHIVSDAWTQGVLSREIAALYRAFHEGRPSSLPELPIQYADYAAWQRGWLSGESLEKQLAYWKKQLAGAPQTLDLPTDRSRPPVQTPRGARRTAIFPTTLTAEVKALAQREGATPFMVLLAAYEVFLHRISGQNDFVVGTPIANRTRAETEHLVGFFVNALALRADLGGEPTFRALIARVKAVCLGAYSHQHVPFEQLVQEISPDRDLGRQPLFQVTFTLNNAPREAVTLPGLAFRGMGGDHTTSKYDLSLAVAETPSGLFFTLSYSTDLFEAATVERMLGHLQMLLASAVAEPDRAIGDLEMLAPEERRTLLVEWNDTARPYPEGRCGHELFEEQVARAPDAIAVIAGDRRLSYAEVNRRANKLAHRLSRLGVAPGALVGVALGRSAEMVIAILAVMKAGGAYVPLDPTYPTERLAFMMADARVRVLLVEPRTEALFPRSDATIVCVDADWRGFEGESAENPPRVAAAHDAAYVIYTSGSTGRPKGVVVEHRGLGNLAATQARAFGVTPASRVLQFASPNFDASVSEIFVTLLAGATLVIAPQEAILPGDDLARTLIDHAISIVTLPPSSLAALPHVELPALATLVVAGEACSEELVDRWARGRALINAYGPTEATVCATMAVCEPGKGRPAIGRPIANVRVYVLDARGEPVPVGVPGELYVGGVGLARGYLDRPELTAERFVESRLPECAGERLYRTGDRVRYRPDGALEFLGRVDHQVKVRGYRIELGEIEALLAAHPGVRDAIAVAREDASGDVRVVAYATDRARGELPELWPSVAEFFVYDEALYHAMTHDERRNRSYRVAIEQRVPGKVVLDVGTGRDAILARLCAEAGASRVYAIELLEASYRSAVETVRRLGLDDRITVIHGDATQVELPELVDVCVSEIVGPIGGCEGAARILNDARRFLREGGAVVAERSTTKIAAVRLPDNIAREPAFTSVTAGYAEQIFEQVGRRFDLRVCIRRLPKDHVLSSAGVFEDLDFRGVVPTAYARDERLVVEQSGRVDGFLVWLTLETIAGEVIDILEHEYCWLPVFVPAFEPGIEVARGDVFEIVCSAALCANGVNPDYAIAGRLVRANGETIAFRCELPHFGGSFRGSPFYRALFEGGAIRVRDELHAPTASELRGHLAAKLPEYMVPSAVVKLDALPLLPNGKVDRKALPAPDAASDAAHAYVEPRGPVEEAIAAIFAEVLGASRVGARDGFFEMGGHSLVATRAIARIRAWLGVDLPLRTLFEAPTVAALATHVEAALRVGRGTEAPPLERAPAGAELTLSFAEERLWFIDQLDPGRATYAVPIVLRLRGALDRSALARSLDALVARHEVLRTSYAAVDGRPVPVIHASAAVSLPVVTVGDPEALRRAIADEVTAPFDLASPPMLRARLFAIGEDEHALVLTMHHIVSDGWSVGVICRELSAFYTAFTRGEPANLPELPLQYRDFARWQRSFLRGDALDRQLAHWRTALEGAPRALELPTDRARRTDADHRGDRRTRTLSREAIAALKDLARSSGVTLFMALVSGLGALLGRLAGQDDVVLGSPIAGRTHRETESLVGVFVNTLVLRVRLAGDPSFRALLARVRETCLGAYAHQDLPFERLVQELVPDRDLGRSPLFQTLFVLQNAPGDPLRLPGLEVRGAEGEVASAKFDLSIAAAESARGLVVSAVFDADLFDGATIERLLERFERLLTAAARTPDTAISRLPLLDDAELHLVVDAWNETRVPYPKDATLHALFASRASETPDAIAVELGHETLTYAELDRRANALAHHLRARGVRPSSAIGLYAARSLDMVVATLAILKAGAAYVPLDPDLPSARLAWIVNDAATSVVVVAGTALCDGLFEGATIVSLDAEAAAIAASPCDALDVAGSADDLAYVMYTSGSTGTPKGVCVVHRGVVRLVVGASYARFASDEVFLQLAPIAFDASTFEVWGALLAGARLALFPPEAPTIEGIGEAIRAHGVTTLWLTAGLFNVIVDQRPEILRPLRQLLVGGEALSVPHVRRALAELPSVRIINGYGPTEGTTFTACHAITSADGESIPIGRPISNTRVYVLDEHRSPTPIGVPGELYVGGDGLARGYLNRADLDADRFVADPFVPGARLYRTGDRVRWLPDGTLAFLGRLDAQIKIRGFRVELGEIEAVLATHANVRECVVALKERDGDKRLVAYVVAKDAAPSDADLRAYLGDRLPKYMVPSAFVAIDALPLSAVGKIDRRALPNPELDLAHDDAPPRSAVEDAIARIFEDVLRIDAVGSHADFFALGGHSLLATQAIARLRTAFAIDLPLRTLFEAPTPAALARRIEDALRGGRASPPPPIVRLPRDGSHTLSFAEERLWFLHQLAPSDPSYVVPMAIGIGGHFSVDALERALSAIVARHEVLRTVYVDEGGTPVASIHEAAPFELCVMRWPGASIEDRRDAARHAMTEELARPFDLASGPLFRALLLAIGDEEHVLFATMHHIVCDAWTLGILRREIEALYAAFSAGSASPLRDLDVQYVDYAAWQRRWLATGVLDAQLGYWKQQLEGVPPSLDLPTDRPRPPIMSHRGELIGFTVPDAIAASLGELGRREGATLFMTLLAAFAILIHRRSGQDDLAIGTPVAGRSRVETEAMAGLFLNTLVLRARVSSDLRFRELLARIKETCLGAYAHEDVPFERLVQEIAPERDMSRSPLFQVMFTVQTARRVERAHAPQSHDPESVAAKFDLSMSFVERSRSLSGSVEYATDLFDRSTIERMIEHLLAILARIADRPDGDVRSLARLPDAERALVVDAWNETRVDDAREGLVHRLFAAQAARAPDASAVSFEGGDPLGYGELDRTSNRLARFLRARGVGRDVLVGVMMDRSSAMVVGLLGILKAGGAYVPLDPAYPRERLAFMAADASLSILLTEDHFADRVPIASGLVVRLDTEWERIADESDAPLDDVSDARSLAYVLYTSGSTGRPKGVMIEHGALASFLAAMSVRPGITASDRVLAVTSLSFDIAGLELWLPLTTGAHVDIASRATASDGAALARRLSDGRITIVQATPSTFRLLLDGGWSGDRDLTILVGGEAVPRDLSDRLGDRARVVWNMYGPTETTIWSCVHHLEKGAPVLIGVPISNTRAYVLDAALEPAPIGVPGELYIGGDGVARGYLGRADLTAERFVPNALSRDPGARLYRTGDLCRFRADGALEFLGRIDFQVKVRGFRVELGEIEAVLVEHASVREAIVVARDGGSASDMRLVAYVVPRSAALAVGELRAFLKDRLPDYMVPSAFVALAALPLTANGKVDRRALPPPESAVPEIDAVVPPRTAIEETLATIFADVLRLPAARVGAHEGFFDLGGHSLLATQVVSRLRHALGVELPLRAIFESPTVAGLALAVQAVQSAGSLVTRPPLRALPAGTRRQASFGQERLWILAQLDPTDPSYNMPLTYRLEGELDTPALARALAEIARRHEVLRTTFAIEGGMPVPIVREPADVPLPVTSLEGVAPDDLHHAARAAITAEAGAPFDLEAGPLFRARLVALGPRDHVLVVTMHHIVSDAWSIDVLRRELGAIYAAFHEGRPSPLPELPVQYADFAAWQRGWLSGDVLERQLAYWKDRLAGAPPALDLPTDRPRPSMPSHRGGWCPIAVAPEIGAALEDLSRANGATLFMTLLAAYVTLLHRTTGEVDVVVGTPTAGRTATEIESSIGFFVNMLAVRTSTAQDPSFVELLARVREACLGAYAHEDVPFERVVQEIAPARDMSRSPIFQVAFGLDAGRSTDATPAQKQAGISAAGGTAKFDLMLALARTPAGLAGGLEYATDLFDRSSVERTASHLVTLLEGIAADPTQRLSALRIMPEAERQRVLVEWNATDRALPDDRLVHELFEEQVDASPDAVAVAFEHDVLTYRALDQRANQLAHALRRRGVGPDVLVAVFMERSLELVVALYAILKAGGAYVPLDPEYPRERLAFMLEDGHARVILTQERLAQSLPDVAAEVLCIDAGNALLASELDTRPARGGLSPESLAYVIYTSGSTGRPKGAMNEHRAVRNRLSWMQRAFPLDRGDRVLQKTPFSFDVSVWELFWPLMFGARLVVATPDGHKDPAYLANIVAAEGITTMHFVPSMLRAFVEEPKASIARSLRRVFASGEALSPALVARFFEAFPGVELHNLYGPTEAAVDVTHWACRAGAAIVPIGRPIDNVRIYVLDDRREPVPIGVRGELYIGGVQVGRGYLNRPELTAERFVDDPFAGGGARMYRTGDLARFLADGTLEYLGRADFQVKIRGFRVELGEIEAALARHAAVRDAVVVARDDGAGDARLVAYVACDGAEPASSELRAMLRERLPEHMIPSAFVTLGALPLTASGKIDRAALPAPDASDGGVAFIAPRTPTEEAIAAIWRDLLRVPRVGANDDFFELGGHSLLATRAMARLTEAMRVDLPLRTLFEVKTVAGLAEITDVVAQAGRRAEPAGVGLEEGEL